MHNEVRRVLDGYEPGCSANCAPLEPRGEQLLLPLDPRALQLS
jgi:hypothetical protein